jgi:PKD repeat protein
MTAAKPVAEFAVSPDEPSISDTIQLFDCSRDPRNIGIAWRAWDFGDGTTSVGLAPAHRYVVAGEYELTLTLATFDGRVGQSSRIVSVGVKAVAC